MREPPITYHPGFVPRQQANHALGDLLEKVAWEQHRVQLFGRWVDCPRLSAWYGDPGAVYGYSGGIYTPRPWLPALSALREAVEEVAGAAFNSVLLNRYRHGQDSMGWHADDEPELGPSPTIASLSLGAARKMRFRRTHDHAVTKDLWLEHGSLLVMQSGCQENWQHALPKTRRVQEERMNLTFRLVRG